MNGEEKLKIALEKCDMGHILNSIEADEQTNQSGRPVSEPRPEHKENASRSQVNNFQQAKVTVNGGSINFNNN